MNHTFAASTLTAMAMILSGPAMAQSPSATGTVNESTGDASALIKASTTTQKPSEMLASDVIGMPVKSGAGDEAPEIGKVTDLVLDQDKRTVNVLIGIGGFLGIGTKDIGVPLSEVKFTPGSTFAMVNMTKDQLEKAPAYTTTSMRESLEKQATQKQQMGQQPLQPALPAPPPGGAAE